MYEQARIHSRAVRELKHLVEGKQRDCGESTRDFEATMRRRGFIPDKEETTRERWNGST